MEAIFQQKETLDLAARALTVVGIIALLIGGVGIANITIAAIIERTSEIGLRRAIGATKINILSQFILEAKRLPNGQGDGCAKVKLLVDLDGVCRSRTRHTHSTAALTPARASARVLWRASIASILYSC